ncbi:hypothetical protein FOZ63_031131, partial [Perkinsus olseni]
MPPQSAADLYLGPAVRLGPSIDINIGVKTQARPGRTSGPSHVEKSLGDAANKAEGVSTADSSGWAGWIALGCRYSSSSYSTMKSFLQILALESRLFETLLKRRSGQAECSGGLLFVFSSLLPQRRYTLDCPREEILVNPPPSYIF